MKSFGMLFVFILSISIATFIYHGCASKESEGPNPVNILIGNMKAIVVSMKNRKLKENINRDEAENLSQMHLEDYRPTDPVPNSKASIKHGPISHGTPVLPFVPKIPPPPSKPKNVGLP